MSKKTNLPGRASSITLPPCTNKVLLLFVPYGHCYKLVSSRDFQLSIALDG